MSPEEEDFTVRADGHVLSVFSLGQQLEGKAVGTIVKILRCHYERSSDSRSSHGTEEEPAGGLGSIIIISLASLLRKFRKGTCLAPHPGAGAAIDRALPADRLPSPPLC